ncbi:MAG: LicD family protein [Cetobacterium sp.]
MSELKMLQEKLYIMLIELDKIFKENNITYYLIGGSALGAVRHQGFIPWDDDIDIGIFRKDFEKAEKILSQLNLNKMKYCKIGQNIIQNAPIGYVYDISNPNLEIKDVPTIDIFPIDGIPENKILRSSQKYISMIYHISVSKLEAKNRGNFLKLLSKIILKITPNFIFNFSQSICKTFITQWDTEKCQNCANIFGQARYNKEIMPKKYFGTPKFIKFEDKLFPVPELTNEYLTHLYNDYMKLPKEEERKPKHKDNI